MEKNKYELQIIKLGFLIKELRLNSNLTQGQLSLLCNVDVRTIQRIERGKQNISISLLFSIADALKIESATLISYVFSENS
ncbi:helix-turn-helix domain-containing protein [Flavobacterium panacagri]|uniref:helix-turn-helix domain-containing protein n=1 Tax=Flavobacterium panacagri TaxID=3034146 RepID=UPI0025A61425|nr:helix-turn-helix transcriptional regulator [Flavobacterium panacagri]